jgi:hypothetical protein
MSCSDVLAALAPFHACVDTLDGARVTTHCLYPSFEPVQIYVVRFGDGFRVHDGGGADRAAWLHGRDEQLIRKMLLRQAARYHLALRDGILSAEAPNSSALLSAILAVANASASAANAVIERAVAAAEHDLVERVYGVLSKRYGTERVKRNFPVIGQSGKQYDFDFGIPRDEKGPILIDTVVPHHASIAHKYVAFSDVAADGANTPDRWAVYDKPLDPEDASLMRQVAALVPFASLDAAMMREAPLR